MAEYKYKAFISYRHLEPDMQAAEKLQKLLESYKPPKNIGKEKKNWRIFRDVSELQTSSDLSEDIRNAIEDSEFLIVICSPEYTKSKWCMQELERFRELHNNTNKNIITLLVAGEPRESFPELLQYNEITTTDENGQEVKVKVEVEPLAANIKADTLKESMKKLNTEYLRIAAPLIGCDFNDLYQREKKREARRRIQIFGTVSGILSLITVISVVSALTISKKNTEIKNKNEQIEAKNEQIEKKNEQIEAKNKDLLVENAEHLAAESERLYSERELVPAVEKAVEALPEANEDKPVIPEAEYALSRQLGLFQNEKLLPQIALKHDSAIEKISFMGEGKSIVSMDATGIYFWDPEYGTLLKKIIPDDSKFASKNSDGANTLNAFFDVSKNKTGTILKNFGVPGTQTYDRSSTFSKIFTNFAHSLTDSEKGTGGDVYLYNSDFTLWRLSGETGDIKWCADASDEAYNYVRIQDDGEHILRVYRSRHTMPGGNDIGGNQLFLEIIDRESGKITDTVDISSIASGSMEFDIQCTISCVKNNNIYAFNSDTKELTAYAIKDSIAEKDKIISFDDDEASKTLNAEVRFFGDDPFVMYSGNDLINQSTNIIRYDDALEEAKWKASVPAKTDSSTSYFIFKADTIESEHDLLAVVTKRNISIIDYETGDIMRDIHLENNIVDACFSDNGLIMFTVNNGEEYTLNVKSFLTDSVSTAAYRIQNFSMDVALCSYSRNKYVTAANYSSTAYIQSVNTNQFCKTLDLGEEYHSFNVIASSDDGSLAAFTASHYTDNKYKDSDSVQYGLFLYSVSDEQYNEVKGIEGCTVADAAFIDNDTLIAAVYTSTSAEGERILTAIDVHTGESKPIEDAPDFDAITVDLVPCSGGVMYVQKTSKKPVRVIPGKEPDIWNKDNDEKYVFGTQIEFRGDKAVMITQERNGSALSAEIYDFSTGKSVPLPYSVPDENSLKAYRLFWLSDDTAGIFYSDRTVKLYNAQTGDVTAVIDLKKTGQEPITVVPLGSEKIGVLCRDSGLYEMDQNGYTGRKLALSSDNDTGNTLVSGSEGEKADRLSMQKSPDERCAYVIWNEGTAWLIDLESFKCRYQINGFQNAPANKDIVYIKDKWFDRTGCYPLYSSEQLIDAAKKYLEKLSEKAQVEEG